MDDKLKKLLSKSANFISLEDIKTISVEEIDFESISLTIKSAPLEVIIYLHNTILTKTKNRTITYQTCDKAITEDRADVLSALYRLLDFNEYKPKERVRKCCYSGSLKCLNLFVSKGLKLNTMKDPILVAIDVAYRNRDTKEIINKQKQILKVFFDNGFDIDFLSSPEQNKLKQILKVL